MAPPKGWRHHNAKLRENDIRDIRASDETDAALARRYGVHPTTLNAARVGDTWQHVKVTS